MLDTGTIGALQTGGFSVAQRPFEYSSPPPAAIPVKKFGRGLAGWQVRRVSEFVLANLDRSISLAELAELVGRSRFHFCTAFRYATGLTPGEWITKERIKLATELLEDFSLSVTEIALQVGYETPSSFTSRFRRSMGVTPSEYRHAL